MNITCRPLPNSAPGSHFEPGAPAPCGFPAFLGQGGRTRVPGAWAPGPYPHPEVAGMAHPGLGQAPAGAMRSWSGPKGWGAASRQGSPVTTRGGDGGLSARPRECADRTSWASSTPPTCSPGAPPLVYGTPPLRAVLPTWRPSRLHAPRTPLLLGPPAPQAPSRFPQGQPPRTAAEPCEPSALKYVVSSPQVGSGAQEPTCVWPPPVDPVAAQAQKARGGGGQEP